MFAAILGVLASTLVPAAEAAIQHRDVTYEHGGVKMVGVLAWDDAVKGKRPGVVVFPEWWGRNAYPIGRADQLAKLGYVAFAADMYGGGRATTDPKEAGKWAGEVRGDPALMRGRAGAALDALNAQPEVDPGRVAAIGYCFGGTAALELARSGADLDGVVSFHGNLDTKRRAEPGDVKAKVLVLHGEADPHVPPETVKAFREEMKAAGADARVVGYPGAVHGFTNPANKGSTTPGLGYQEEADRKSWEEMKGFLGKVLGQFEHLGGGSLQR